MSEHQIIESKLGEKAVAYEHNERTARRVSVSDEAFNRRHSASFAPPRSRRESLKASFSIANEAMVFPDKTNIELSDADVNAQGQTIEDMGAGWFVWLVAATASIAGSLFGYDTGIISAVLVYLGNDLGGHPASANDKELITSLCSGGAFIGSIIAGLTADKVRLLVYCCFNPNVSSSVAKLPSTLVALSSPSALFYKPLPIVLLKWLSVDWWLDSALALQLWLSLSTSQRSPPRRSGADSSA